MSFAPRIEEIMRARGMSQVALAHALGITSQAVSNWLNNANGVVGKRLPKIAAALCVEITDLVAAVGSPIPPLLSGEELAKTVIHPLDNTLEDKARLWMVWQLRRSRNQIRDIPCWDTTIGRTSHALG
jgi:transcriptional regulator with XRE-family HTH domain